MKKIGFLSIVIIMSLAVIMPLGHRAYGQERVTIGLGSIRMNIHEYFRPDGNVVNYPRDYSVYTELIDQSLSVVRGSGFGLACRNFKAKWYYPTGTRDATLEDGGWIYVGDGNPAVTIPYYAVDVITSYHADKIRLTIPIDLKCLWKYPAPERIVDGMDYSTPAWQEAVDVVNPNIISEQMGTAVTNTPSGITVIQRGYAFAHPDYDEFIIVEYVFKNTGNIDSDDEIEYPNNKLEDCYLGLKYAPQVSGLGSRLFEESSGWGSGADEWIDYYGGGANDTLRVMYGWDGDARSTYCAVDDEGDPLPASGIFMSYQYPGMAILHVDKAVNDKSDDPDQPILSYYSWGGNVAPNLLSVVNIQLGQEGIWNTYKDGGYFTSPLDWDAYYSSGGATEVWAPGTGDGDPNIHFYKTGTLGFGPFQFSNIGDSIRIVACYTVGGMGWDKAISVGKQWKDKEITKEQKNWEVRKGRADLFSKVGRVRSLFKKSDGTYDFSMAAGSTIDQRIGDPPQWPDLTITSVIAGVKLEWSDVSADNYRVYRRLKPAFYLEDPGVETHILVHEAAGTEFEWTDTDVIPGRNYWYHVTAVKNGIESSQFVNRTSPTQDEPTKGSASPFAIPPKTLENVTVVPNPYHAHATRLYDWTQNKINFMGLPASCRIRIYTQTGDLVETLDHELSIPPSSTEEWLQLTESDQYIASGLYIYVVDETKDHEGNDLGLSKIGKFVVIR